MTKQSVIIHKNEKLGLEITPRTRRAVRVRREGVRVRISAGGGYRGGDEAGWRRKTQDGRLLMEPPALMVVAGE